MLVGVFEKRGPVLDGAHEVADVDEVEAVGFEFPGELEIADLEIDVVEAVGGLDWGQVCSYDFGVWVLGCALQELESIITKIKE